MDEKQAVTQVFNLVADLYDNPSLRFFPSCAEKIIEHAKLKRGQKVLDIATGTGMVAIAAAKAVGNQSRVQAIDLAESMISQAQANMKTAGINNIDFHIMDAENLDFKSNQFDLITCSYGLFFIPNMRAALKSWLHALKPGGRLIFTSFAPSAFKTLTDIFLKNLADYGISPPTPSWLQLAEDNLCQTLLIDSGFESAQVTQTQLGYHLQTADDWWQAVQSAGYRGLYEQLPQDKREEFKTQHLADIQQLNTEQGIWMDVQTLFSTAVKPH